MGANRDWARMKARERMEASERALEAEKAERARIAQLEEDLAVALCEVGRLEKIVSDLEGDLYLRDERIEALRRQLARPQPSPTPAQFSRVRDYTEEA